MTRLVALVAACVAVALVAAATPSAGTSPLVRMRTVEGTLRLQTQLFLQRRWRLLWRTYSPRFRARCDYAAFVALNRQQRGQITAVNVRRVRVRVRGRRALATYELLLNGIALQRVTAAAPDVYVRVGGRWYDELDPHTLCPPRGATA